MFAVDLDRIEREFFEFADGAVPKRMGDDRRAVPIVGAIDGFARRERLGFDLGWRIRADDEHVPARGRNLDPREGGDVVRRAKMRVVIVVGRREAVKASATGRPAKHSDPQRVEFVAEIPAVVEEARVSV